MFNGPGAGLQCFLARPREDFSTLCQTQRLSELGGRDDGKHACFQLEIADLKSETGLVRWKKITLVGVGLLGGSLGMALKQRRLAKTVVGFVRRAASVRECERLGAVDFATQDLEKAVADAELIVICTPIGQM